MRGAEPKGSLDDLRKNTNGFLARFDVDVGPVVDRLATAARTYNERSIARRAASTRGSVITELRDLSERPDDLLASAIAILGASALQALCGLFPSPLLAMTNRKNASSAIAVLDHEKLLVHALKSRLSHQSGQGDLHLLDVTVDPMDLSGLVRNDLAKGRRILAEWAPLEPKEFRQHIDRTIDRLEAGFQVAGQSGGRNVNIYEGVEAPPEWCLIRDVLDIIWPVANGGLHSSKMEAAHSIIDQTMYYAVGNSNQNFNLHNSIVNHEMTKCILTLRRQISLLNESIGPIERRLHSFSNSFSDAIWIREQRTRGNGLFPAADVATRA